MSLTFKEVSKANLIRSNKWHNKSGLEEWSISDWAVALAGECGEVCNAVKKLNRVRDGIANISSDKERQLDSYEKAIAYIGNELADTYFYLDLLSQRLGINLEEKIKEVFNNVSIKYGFEDRL